MSRQAPSLPGLFDETAGPPVPQPRPQTEPARLAKAALRVLALLQDGQWHSNVEISHPDCGGLAGVRRCWDLQQRGHEIAKRHVRRGHWEYRLVKP